MKDWRKAVIGEEDSLLRALAALDAGALRIALVTDGDDQLRGVVTDGDVRRALLRGAPLETPVREVMRRDFYAAPPQASAAELLRLMRERDVQQIPLVDEAGRVTGVRRFSEIFGATGRPNAAVIMAGGLGTRLRPLTDNCPKPLLQVGGKAVIDTILDRLMACGVRRFYVSVNYLGEQIKAHLGDGQKRGAMISYLEEHERLGTAGALGLLEAPMREPFIVINGDILTRLDFGALLDFHNLSGSVATMGVREYRYQVPYGVVRADGGRLVTIEEKPTQCHFVNAGVYALSPEALAFVEKGAPLDMPGLFSRLAGAGRSASVYPVVDYWTDIGSPDDLRRADEEYSEVFK